MATFIGFEIRAPRHCVRQVNRDSYGASDPQTYYRLSACMPFLDFLIHELKDRVLKHRGVSCSFSALLAHRIAEERTDPGPICSTLLDKYPEDFSTASVDMFKTELQIWKRFWGKKKSGGRTPQLYRKLEILRCSHFSNCLHSNKNCDICSSDSRTCTVTVLHIEETKNLPEEYNGRGASQRACTNERSQRHSARYR